MSRIILAFRICKFLAVTITTCGFIWLAQYSQRTQDLRTLAEYGITPESAPESSPDGVSFKIKSQPVKTYRMSEREKAEVIADLWNINLSEVSEPVHLFGKDGGKI